MPIRAATIRIDDARNPRALSDSSLSEEAVMRVTDKVAIVTGAGSGIGAAIARTFAREGAKVTITGRRKEPLDAVADGIAAAGGHALAVSGSVTDEADVQRAVQATLATFGRIDVLVNNAGSMLHAGPLHETSDDVWDGVMDVFLKGVFRFSRAVIPHMQRQGGGSIVNIGSVLGLKAALAFPVHPYAVAKAGVAMLTKTIAVHYAKDGIRCNCVAPALTETPLIESRLKDAAVRKTMEAQYPLGRLGRPDDIAQAVLYLASDDAAWTTGTIVTVDGGIMA
jgi:NAD(P)-dependent dehydrogenase (short-subunit alcohol dehydrogenase family)